MGLSILAYLGLRLWVGLQLPPLPDEAYYWTWSSTPGWSYFDHPPAIAWILAFSRWLVGESLFALRAPAWLAGAVTMLCLASAAAVSVKPYERVEVFAQACALCAAAPMFALGGLVSTPDVYLGAVISISMLSLALSERHRFWAPVTGLFFSILVLFKHAGGVVAIGGLIAAVGHHDGPRRLRDGRVGILLGSVSVLYWLGVDLSSDGASVFQWGRVHQPEAGEGVRALFLVPLALIVTGNLIGAWGVVSTIVAHQRKFLFVRIAQGGAAALVMSCCYASWRGKGEWHWVYPAVLLSVPVAAIRLFTLGGRVGRSLRRLSYALAIAGCMLTLSAGWYELKSPLGKRDPRLRGVGYKELITELRSEAESWGTHKVITRRYQLASLLRFHLGPEWDVIELGMDRPSNFDREQSPKLCPKEKLLALLYADHELPANMYKIEGGWCVESAVDGLQVLVIEYVGPPATSCETTQL